MLGVLCFYASITLLVWRLTDGELHPPSISGGSDQYSPLASFFNGSEYGGINKPGRIPLMHSLKNLYSKDLQFQVPLDQVKKVFFAFDPLEIHRFKLFPEFPMWLTLELKSGKKIRICKGRRVDLVPVLNWLVAAGLPYRD